MKNFKVLCSNSILEKEFKSKLENPHIKVVSFDIFDTLVSRDVRDPKDIFFLLGNHKKVKTIFNKPKHFKLLRVYAEKNAREKVNHEEITLNQIYENLPLTKIQSDEIKKLELNLEEKNLHINKQVINWIKLAKKYKKRIILISDMYLNKQQLTRLILNKIKDKNLIDFLYVSSEYKKTKYEGSLFAKILKLENIEAKNLLHVGDNKKADVEMPSRFGINTVYYNFDNYLHTISEWEAAYCTTPINNGQHYRKWASMLNPYQNKKQRFFFNEGAFMFGPILWEFSCWIEKLAQQNQVDKIFCVMREGRIFKKCLDFINPKLGATLFYASRKSTFLASFDMEDMKKNGLDFYKFRKFTIKNFYELFKIKPTNTKLNKYEDILIKNANSYYVGAENLIVLISRDFNANIENIEKIINHERKKFQLYYKQKGGNKHTMLVDFGGGGTIIKNIDRILNKNKPKINALFYIRQHGYENINNLNIVPFIDLEQKKVEFITRSPEFTEILFNGINQTTLGYKQNKSEITPITKFPSSNIKDLISSINAFDAGIEAFFSINKKDKQHSYAISDMFLRIINMPSKKEAKYFGNLYHDEGYGSDYFEHIIKKAHLEIIEKIGVEKFYFNFYSNSTYMSKQITWPQGCIAKIDSYFLPKINLLFSQSTNALQINQLLAVINENDKISSLFIYGAGDFGKECYKELVGKNITIKGIIDSKAEFNEFYFKHFKVKSLQNSKIQENDTILVTSGVFAIDITDFIKKNKKVNRLNIINCYNGLIKL